jgi:hypothetical protein
MPEKKTLERVERDRRQGKAPTTQAGEFVREEIEHIREGKHGARSAKQAIAIGLSKARRAGVPVPPPPGRRSSASTRNDRTKRRAARPRRKRSRKRAQAVLRALKHEPRRAASHRALARHAREVARKRRRRRTASASGSS